MPKHFVRRIQKMAIASYLILSMLSISMPAAWATSLQSVEVMSAPLTTRSSATNGMVRVYLSSLGNPGTLNLTINGKYSVNGNTSQTISNGSSVTVNFSSSTGAITLTRNGTKTNMGTYFALRRHSSSGENGVKIAQARESGNLYPGDISFRSVYQNGAYKLYTVAHIYIENYLYGVLPYEMGNSTNIEALKAQAVAARTYTVRQMQSRASGYFDVYDTTSDQVYRGTPSGNANCVAAVNGTKGIVVMYGSNYITTYYSASNGGQTETVRSGGSYPYLTVKDDPFDYANSSSTVKKATIYTNLSSGSNNASLMSLLKTKAVSKLKSSYGATSGNTTLQTLKSVTPHTPKYSSPSRLYTKMDFTLTANVNGRTATTTVTCDIFSELESMLNMGIQSSQNELWSVQKSSSSFQLQARRFGHGYGMSQRGAMYMAKLGYTYDQILGFYYVGCKRVQFSFTNTILNDVGDTQTSIEDPADIDDNNDALCRATVKLVSAGSTLAIRTQKSITSGMVGTAGNGAIMTVLSNDGTWCFVEYGNLKGYVPTNALSITGTPGGSEGTPSSILGFVTVTASDFVNLRSAASMSGSIVSTAPSGAVLTVFSKSGSWAYVQYNATVAHVNTGYISSVTTTYPSKVSSTGNATAVIVTEDGMGTVNLRASASTDASVLAKLDAGTEISVSSDDGSWCVVTYNGKTGYILSQHISYTDESLDNNTEGGSGEDGSSTDGVSATVSTEIGYLREQANNNAASVLMIGYGETVLVTERGSEWCAVSYNGEKGYMLTSSLSFGSSGGGNVIARAVVTTASGSLNMRAEAKAGSQILTQIPRNTEIDVTSVGSTWCGVSYSGLHGYVMSSFLTFTSDGGETETPDGNGGAGTATVTTQSGSLNLRIAPRAGSTILRTIPRLSAVTVNEYGYEWCSVTYQGTTGYVMTVFLTFANEELPDDPDVDDPDVDDPDVDDPDVNDPDVNDPDEPIVPDPGENEDTLYAVVTTVSGSLNLRRDALPGSDVLARIPKGTTIVISERLSAWSQTTYAGQTGYVMNAYLTFRQGQPEPTEGDSATVNTISGSLNLRTEPSKGGGVILRIPQYATVSVQQRGSQWCYVAYAGSYGYVMTEFLAFGESDGTLPDDETDIEDEDDDRNGENDALIAYVTTASGSLNLRLAAQSGSRILTTIPRGAAVTVTSYGAAWCQVIYNSFAGYAMTEFLRFETPIPMAGTDSSDNNTDASPADKPTVTTPTDENTTNAVTAWVVTDSGSLNLRETPNSDGRIIDAIPRLAAVKLLKPGDDWCYVEYQNQLGYAMTRFLTRDEPSGAGQTSDLGSTNTTPTQPSTIDTSSGMALDITLEAPDHETYALVTPKNGSDTLALWSECSEQVDRLETMPRGERVEVILRGDTWCLVDYQSWQGYCLTKYLNIGVE